MGQLEARDDEHTEDLLGLYALGRLDADEDARVERHLAVCTSCRTLADEGCDAAVLLMSLSADDIPSSTVSPPGPHAAPAQRRRVRPAHAGPAGRRDPTARGVPSRPPTRGRRNSVGVILAAILAAAVLIAGGGAAGIWWQTSRQADLSSQAVASHRNNGGGATASVELSEKGDEMRLVIIGFRPRADFQVIAVTADGKAHAMFRGQAVGSAQLVVVPLTIAADQIHLIVVAQLDGVAVVAVPVRWSQQS